MHVLAIPSSLFVILRLLVSAAVSLNVDLHSGREVGGAPPKLWTRRKKYRGDLKSCIDKPPILSNDTVADILDGYDAAYFRRDRLTFLEKHLNFTHEDAKIGYAEMYRRCRPMFFQECRNPNAVALIMSGQTRSFLNPEVLLYWKRVVDAIRTSGRLPVLFAVLDEVSLSRFKPGTPSVKHNDSIQVLQQVLTELDAGSNFVFLHGKTSMDVHASYVMDPALRKLLTPADDREAKYMGAGSECGFMKMAIGLDLMLQYERFTQTCFSHVFRARPDYVFLNWEHPSYLAKVWNKLDDMVYMINDVVAMMPREHAGAYFTTFLMHRAIKNATQKAAKDMLDSFVRNGRGGSLGQPTTWVAYNGIMFAGHGLEIDTWKGIQWAGEIDDDDIEDLHTHGFLVRENEHGNCLGNESTLIEHNISLPLCDR